MRLGELLDFDDIVIQCHDNPDADALASGYALWWYFKQKGKHARFIYRGRNEITKSNLLIMLEKLSVPVSYAPDFDEIPELLVTVDCQYGQRNVTETKAKTVAVIDHHQSMDALPELAEVRSNIGSCSTILWDMIRAEGLSLDADKELSTALYYGLYTDTNRLTEMSHPLDRDMADTLIINRSIITEMSNSNISLEELKITGKAILDYEYHRQYKYLIIEAEQCDPNILGVISDFSMETAGVDVCMAFYVSEGEIKFSVRSCVKEVKASELAAFLAEGIGGGGGHLTKAGGTIRPEKLAALASDPEQVVCRRIFSERMDAYFEKYEILYAKETVLSMEGMKHYEKREQRLGCVKLSEVFPVQTLVEIRTLEGDVSVRIDDEKYLMIGLEGEVYPITAAKKAASYRETGDAYARQFEYAPRIKNVFTGEYKEVLPFAKEVASTGTSQIFARPLTRHIKLFTAWDDEKYYTGTPGDYIATREDDPHDIYIIKGRLFDQLYAEI